MNFQVKLRLIGFAAGIGLMGLAIAFMTVKAQRRAAELRRHLTQVDSESFRIADQFGDYLRELNDSLYSYGRSHVPPDLKAFDKTSHELDLWIDEQKPKLTTPREQTIMQQIDAVYKDYLEAAKKLLARLQAMGDESAKVDDYADLRSQSRRLFDLGQNLSRAHFASRNQILARANQAITEWHASELISLGLLFVFAVALSVIVYRDMIVPLRTKLVESQALVERHEKLASLGLLAAGIAHEIRNPLTAIKAALFIQQKKFQPGTQEFLDAKVVEREILRLERIVNDFLLFARPTEPQLASVPVASLFHEVQILLSPQLARNQIQLLLEAPPALQLRADAAQIKQVLINLIQNAADAIAQNGVVKLRARQDRKRLAYKVTSVVILEVEDNGKGISQEVRKRLFDPFFTTKDTGTGLGLSIAAGIVQKHAGALEYQTALGHGTTFGIVLPAASGQAAGRAA